MDWVNKHLQIIPINTFIDPIFPVENAIITHAHADHAKPGHKNVLATKHTIKIMKTYVSFLRVKEGNIS